MLPEIARQLVLQQALAYDTVSVIACPVDYTANPELIRTLGDLDESA